MQSPYHKPECVNVEKAKEIVSTDPKTHKIQVRGDQFVLNATKPETVQEKT